jgi:hypothetical protein
MHTMDIKWCEQKRIKENGEENPSQLLVWDRHTIVILMGVEERGEQMIGRLCDWKKHSLIDFSLQEKSSLVSHAEELWSLFCFFFPSKDVSFVFFCPLCFL